MYDVADGNILDRILDPVNRCLTPDVRRRILQLRADPVTQARIEELAEKSTQGQLSADEQAEYETYVRAMDFVAVLQSKAHAALDRSDDS